MPDNLRILLIDDMQTQFYLIEGLLLQFLNSEFELEWTAQPESSLEMLQNKSYDVTLLDYDLGDYSALDFLNLFRDNNITTPVIVLTGHGSFDIDVAVMNAGAIDFIDKSQLNGQILERSIRYAVDRARYTDALRESELRFRAMVEKGSDLIIQLDGNGKIIYASPSITTLLGYSETDLLNQSLTDFLHTDDLDNLANMLEQLVTAPASPPKESYRIQKANDDYVWFEFVGTNLLATKGIEAIVINGRDISEQHRRLEIEQQQLMIAEALLDTSITLNSTLNFDDVIHRILENIGTIIPHQSANVMFIDEKGHTQVKAASGYDSYIERPDLNNFVFDVASTLTFMQMMTTRSPLLINDTKKSKLWKTVDKDMKYQSYLGAPIIDHDTVIGFINLENLQAGKFSDNDVEYIQIFAFLASIAIANARAYNHAQELAVVEERQRLARELHDAVSQTLFSASVIADSLTKSDFANTEHLRTGLNKLAQFNRGALAEMRSLLVELRPQSIVSTPLGDLVKGLCDSWRGRSNFDVDFKITGESKLLPPNVQLNLYRLVQEILNNIYKHAGASIVNIELRHQKNVEIVIADDGVGFDINFIPPNHHGIRIMRERAEKIGASLYIDTAIDEGTFIQIIWQEENHGVYDE